MKRILLIVMVSILLITCDNKKETTQNVAEKIIDKSITYDNFAASEVSMTKRDTNGDYKRRDLVKFVSDFVIWELNQSHQDLINRSLKDKRIVTKIKQYRKILGFKMKSTLNRSEYEYACNPDNGEYYISYSGDPDEIKYYYDQTKSSGKWTVSRYGAYEERLESTTDWVEKKLKINIKVTYFNDGSSSFYIMRRTLIMPKL